MPRTISSEWTPFSKFIFPAIWLGMMGIIGLVGGQEIGGQQVLWHLLPILAVGLVGFLLFSARLKLVRMDDEALYVSNYRREIRIPFSEVERVSGFTKRVVTIHFRTETEFGRKVRFMPKIRWFDFDPFGPHPIVAELEDAIYRKTGR